LKSEAKKLAAAKNIKLSQAQAEIADRYHAQSFSLLIHSTQIKDGCRATQTQVHAAFSAFIKGLSEATLHKFVRYEGSVWVDKDDFNAGRLTFDSFEALGGYMDMQTRQYARSQNLVFALDVTGMSQAFFFGEEDEPFDLKDQQIYTPESARQWLLDLSHQGEMADTIQNALEAASAHVA
jgi:hypothetical protein